MMKTIRCLKIHFTDMHGIGSPTVVTPHPHRRLPIGPDRPGGRRTRSASAVEGAEESEENRSSGAPAHRRNCLRARGEGGARSATGGKHERGEQKGDLKIQIAF